MSEGQSGGNKILAEQLKIMQSQKKLDDQIIAEHKKRVEELLLMLEKWDFIFEYLFTDRDRVEALMEYLEETGRLNL